MLGVSPQKDLHSRFQSSIVMVKGVLANVALDKA